MDPASPHNQGLARHLLALEASSASAGAHEATQVCEKLRLPLTRFAGTDGFASLLRRASALARAQDPSVGRITIQPDSTIEGFAELAPHGTNNGEAGVLVIAHMLDLIEMFIGAPLMLRLVRDAWPGASLEHSKEGLMRL